MQDLKQGIVKKLSFDTFVQVGTPADIFAVSISSLKTYPCQQFDSSMRLHVLTLRLLTRYLLAELIFSKLLWLLFTWNFQELIAVSYMSAMLYLSPTWPSWKPKVNWAWILCSLALFCLRFALANILLAGDRIFQVYRRPLPCSHAKYFDLKKGRDSLMRDETLGTCVAHPDRHSWQGILRNQQLGKQLVWCFMWIWDPNPWTGFF